MYIQTVLAPWWQKQQTSWTGPPDEFSAKRLLLVCDNASVHKVLLFLMVCMRIVVCALGGGGGG
jgi:hypothetical protein